MYEVENRGVCIRRQLATDVYRKETASERPDEWMIISIFRQGRFSSLLGGYINQTAAPWVYNPRISFVAFAAVLRSRFVSERERERRERSETAAAESFDTRASSLYF
jgi:hypothetical protein